MPKAFTETRDGLWFPSPAYGGASRWGCGLIVSAAVLAAGIVAFLNGHVALGWGLIAGDLVLTVLFLLQRQPFGLAVTAEAVRLETRNFFVRDVLEVRRSDWLELWVDEASEEVVAVYLNARSPDRRKTTYAIPIISGPRQTAENAAERVAGLLRLPRLTAFVPPMLLPGAGGFQDLIAFGMAEYRRAREQSAEVAARAVFDPAAARLVGKVVVTFRAFGCRDSPEAWLLAPERATLTHQAHGGQRTEHAFRDVAAVEAEPEKVGEEQGPSDETSYTYVYRVVLVLASGERLVVRRCLSSEAQKTETSGALRDAERQVRSLRKLFGTPEK
jgi:hypothetical protein